MERLADENKNRCGDPPATPGSGTWEEISLYAGSTVNSSLYKSKLLRSVKLLELIKASKVDLSV
jgi:hypothetical protein